MPCLTRCRSVSVLVGKDRPAQPWRAQLRCRLACSIRWRRRQSVVLPTCRAPISVTAGARAKSALMRGREIIMPQIVNHSVDLRSTVKAVFTCGTDRPSGERDEGVVAPVLVRSEQGAVQERNREMKARGHLKTTLLADDLGELVRGNRNGFVLHQRVEANRIVPLFQLLVRGHEEVQGGAPASINRKGQSDIWTVRLRALATYTVPARSPCRSRAVPRQCTAP